MSISKAQLNRDKKAILSILANETPKSFAEISLQGGEGLWKALKQLIIENKVKFDSKENGYVLILNEMKQKRN